MTEVFTRRLILLVIFFFKFFVHYFCKNYIKFYFYLCGVLNYLFDHTNCSQNNFHLHLLSFYAFSYYLGSAALVLNLHFNFISYNLCIPYNQSLLYHSMKRYHLIFSSFIFNAFDSAFFPHVQTILTYNSLVHYTH